MAEQPTQTAAPTAQAAPVLDESRTPPADAAAELAAAFAQDEPKSPQAQPAAPASTDAPPAEADLTDEEAERLAKHPKVREHNRREIDKREADKRMAEQRADDERKQREAIDAADREIDDLLTIANDPYHERHDEVQKQLVDSALMAKVRQRAMRDPEFITAVNQHIEAVTAQAAQEARVTAVKGAIEQFGDDPDFAKVKPERLAELRRSPDCNTVPKFAKALLREAGWLPPDEVAKREKAAAEDARTRALGGWEPRDFAPSEGRGAATPVGAFDWKQDARASLERAFRQEDARSNGRAAS